MARRIGDIPVQVPFSPEQKVILDKLANGLSLNNYIRSLVAEAADASGIDWPDADVRKYTNPEQLRGIRKP